MLEELLIIFSRTNIKFTLNEKIMDPIMTTSFIFYLLKNFNYLLLKKIIKNYE